MLNSVVVVQFEMVHQIGLHYSFNKFHFNSNCLSKAKEKFFL